jgi:hypothetical protein
MRLKDTSRKRSLITLIVPDEPAPVSPLISARLFGWPVGLANVLPEFDMNQILIEGIGSKLLAALRTLVLSGPSRGAVLDFL